MGDRSRQRATVRDVATHAGVSAMTVSRVLNRSPLVADETAERVRIAIDAVGFRLNQSARNLRRQRTVPMIGLVLNDITNPFHAGLSRGVEDVADTRDALLVVSSSRHDPERERDAVTALLQRGIDGLLMHPASGDHSYLQGDLTEKRPLVLLGQRPSGVDADSVLADNVGGAILAVEHLIDHGHRRIGLIGYGRDDPDDNHPEASHRRGRVEGYRRALDAAGIAFDPYFIRWCSGVDEATAAVAQLADLQPAPTALVTLNNRMTIGALRALGLGLRGLALVGFDDFELADVFEPGVSVVAADPDEMGRRAATRLFARLDGRGGVAKHDVLPMQLVSRGSGERRPAHT